MHERFSDLLQQYIDQEINPLEKMILEEHLLSCRTCRRELNQFKLLDWELKHQPAIELPAELAAYRMAALKTHFAANVPQRKSSVARDLGRVQLQILVHASSFLGYNPVNRTVSRTFKRSLSLLGKMAGASLKKRNPLLARFIPGRI
ncbi:MAG: zf-HC2 domain-containing protein [Bacillota bacterium]|nr:zf-HC2 domain-containing protein [Bacillota bacterium]